MTDVLTKVSPQLQRRHASETRFQWYGRLAIVLSLGFLVIMAATIAWQAVGALNQTYIALEVDLSADNVDPQNLADASYG